jgi:enamine deaminase RidA (YjgF/YER057c/UK114 family)
MPGTVAARLESLGLELPPPFAPVATYDAFVQTGNLVYISGMGPTWDKEIRFQGTVGAEVDVATAQQAARLTALNLVAHLQTACGGDLDRVRRCVKIFGLVNSAPDFNQQHLVVNGASDVLAEIFGDGGPHARAAVAAAALPLDITVELDAVFEVS